MGAPRLLAGHTEVGHSCSSLDLKLEEPRPDHIQTAPTQQPRSNARTSGVANLTIQRSEVIEVVLAKLFQNPRILEYDVWNMMSWR